MVRPVPTVNAALFNERGEVLLTQRASELSMAGYWCLPGGHLEGGERWLDAVVREIFEEVGLRLLEPLNLVGIYSDPALTVTRKKRLHVEESIHYVACVFKATQFLGTPIVTPEVAAYQWCSQGNYPEPLVRSHWVRLEDAFNFQGLAFTR